MGKSNLKTKHFSVITHIPNLLGVEITHYKPYLPNQGTQ